MSISLEDLRDLMTAKRDELLRAVRSVLLSDPSPFDLSFEEFDRLDEDAQVELTRRAWALREEWIEKELRDRQACWIVVVGDEVVASGDDLDGIPDDDAIDDTGRRRGRAPFLFTRPLVEETA